MAFKDDARVNLNRRFWGYVIQQKKTPASHRAKPTGYKQAHQNLEPWECCNTECRSTVLPNKIACDCTADDRMHRTSHRVPCNP